jgi:hypothetical protein
MSALESVHVGCVPLIPGNQGNYWKSSDGRYWAKTTIAGNGVETSEGTFYLKPSTTGIILPRGGAFAEFSSVDTHLRQALESRSCPAYVMPGVEHRRLLSTEMPALRKGTHTNVTFKVRATIDLDTGIVNGDSGRVYTARYKGSFQIVKHADHYRVTAQLTQATDLAFFPQYLAVDHAIPRHGLDHGVQLDSLPFTFSGTKSDLKLSLTQPAPSSAFLAVLRSSNSDRRGLWREIREQANDEKVSPDALLHTMFIKREAALLKAVGKWGRGRFRNIASIADLANALGVWPFPKAIHQAVERKSCKPGELTRGPTTEESAYLTILGTAPKPYRTTWKNIQRAARKDTRSCYSPMRVLQDTLFHYEIARLKAAHRYTRKFQRCKNLAQLAEAMHEKFNPAIIHRVITRRIRPR